jgi:flagellin
MLPTIQTNNAATEAARNLAKASSSQARSLARLSSGSRLVETADDAAGTAVYIKTGAAIRRQGATETNISNALSLMQTQAASLQAISGHLSRMTELVVRMQDVTQSTEDLDNYMTEFNEVREAMGEAFEDKFNGIDLLFYQGANVPLTVFLDETGTQTMTMARSDFSANSGWATLVGTTKPYTGLAGVTDTPASLIDETIWGSSSFQVLTQDLATMMAENGATQSRLEFALDAVRNQKLNFEQATSRIGDTDVAAETTRLARANILVQSGASALTQANASGNVLMKLIQG